jgi:hypothetical protein
MMKCAVENAKVGNAVGIISAEMSAQLPESRHHAFHLLIDQKGDEA